MSIHFPLAEEETRERELYAEPLKGYWEMSIPAQSGLLWIYLYIHNIAWGEVSNPRGPIFLYVVCASLFCFVLYNVWNFIHKITVLVWTSFFFFFFFFFFVSVQKSRIFWSLVAVHFHNWFESFTCVNLNPSRWICLPVKEKRKKSWRWN